MGYTTDFKLTWFLHPKVTKPGLSKILDINEQIGDYILANLSQEPGMDRDGEVNDVKWYQYRRDMLIMSMAFDVVLKLSGQGEDHEDLWVEYYYHGRYQREEAVITFGAFEPEKLMVAK